MKIIIVSLLACPHLFNRPLLLLSAHAFVAFAACSSDHDRAPAAPGSGGAGGRSGASASAGRTPSAGERGLAGGSNEEHLGGAAGDASDVGVAGSALSSAGAAGSQANGDNGGAAGNDARAGASGQPTAHAGSNAAGGEAGSVEVVEPVMLPDPASVGGPLTSSSYGGQPFLSPAPVDEVLLGGFSIGRELFVADWLVAPNATRPTIDGLGPLFHAPSCLACHQADRRAPTLQDGGNVGFGLLFRLASVDAQGGSTPGDPMFGAQLQPSAIPSLAAEGVITWSAAPDVPAGITANSARPLFTVITDPSWGALASTTRIQPRNSPQLVGAGLLELVDDQTLLALEDPDDLDGDGVSGRAARLTVRGAPAIGRFGWKAIHPTLREQTSAAFAGDIGITSPVHPKDDCTASEGSCLLAANGGVPEISSANLDAIDQFMTYLAVPAARRSNDDPQQQRGAALFEHIGCARCHRPSLVSGDAPSAPSLARRTFFAYTDLLLHDLGAGLADAAGEGAASASEWRTPPLWGLGLVEGKPNARFLHDARASTLSDAIRWHGGEALPAQRAFVQLADADQSALLGFLRSL